MNQCKYCGKTCRHLAHLFCSGGCEEAYFGRMQAQHESQCRLSDCQHCDKIGGKKVLERLAERLATQ